MAGRAWIQLTGLDSCQGASSTTVRGQSSFRSNWFPGPGPPSLTLQAYPTCLLRESSEARIQWKAHSIREKGKDRQWNLQYYKAGSIGQRPPAPTCQQRAGRRGRRGRRQPSRRGAKVPHCPCLAQPVHEPFYPEKTGVLLLVKQSVPSFRPSYHL